MVEERGLFKKALSSAKKIQAAAKDVMLPPLEITAPVDQPVLPHTLFKNTRGYIEKVVYQVNRTYEHTCYDACAVMIRRLVEMLIIEAFEHHKMSGKIKDGNGDYLMLAGLIKAALDEKAWTLGKTTKKALKHFKTIGDLSAHSRNYNARRRYIDDVIIDLRTTAEDLLYIAGLKK